MENINRNTEEYYVERIDAKRIVNGQIQYFLKWKGYNETENTWEAVENMNCDDLIAAFEAKEMFKNIATGNQVLKEEEEGKEGEQLKPLKIVGATKHNEHLLFLMQWKNRRDFDWINAKEANIKYPQIVIKFYEEKITFHSDDENDN
uniref:Chromo domain-containing protein n=1 Tax=Glossina brevipalpis TaxID=37001 RepID=A0A1A9WT80_9MUSC